MKIPSLPARFAITGVSILTAAASICAAQTQPSIAWRYNFVKLDYPNSPVSFPLGINSSRQIVGVQVDKNGVSHGYLYQNGKFTDIDYPGAPLTPGGGTSAGGINDRGDIAGVFWDAQGYQHGFLRTVGRQRLRSGRPLQACVPAD